MVSQADQKGSNFTSKFSHIKLIQAVNKYCSADIAIWFRQIKMRFRRTENVYNQIEFITHIIIIIM